MISSPYIKVLYSLFYATLVISSGCSSQRKGSANSLQYRNGIYVETFDSSNSNANRYTKDNFVFTSNRRFIYAFEHIDTSGNRFYFTRDTSRTEEMNYSWRFVPIEAADSLTIKSLVLDVLPGLEPMVSIRPNYDQTVISYSYPVPGGTYNDHSWTGVIENKKNVWLHPPRDYYFRVLQLNPFPFIQAPYEVGNTWEWKLEVGSNAGDHRWVEWEGIIHLSYTYKIVGEPEIKTELGNLRCFKVEGIAQSEIGETRTTSYFNIKHGFVRIDFHNIDGSQTILELTEVTE